MSARRVLVVRTGTANLASVCAGLRRVGAVPQLTDDPVQVRSVGRVVLPGVGSFGAALASLKRHGLDEAISARILAGRPTLLVCLGLQLLCIASDESPETPGLGIIPARITRFSGVVCVPQIGWNYVRPSESGRFVTSGYAYFANSYKLEAAPDGWSAAYANHGGRFVAALERGDLLACQFHPELSGAWGLKLLHRWLTGTRPDRGGAC